MEGAMVKRPTPKLGKPAQFRRVAVTKQVDFEADLPEKVKRKFFVFQQQIAEATFCYVPCWYVVLDYCVTVFGKNSKREGRLDFIYDEKRGCSVIDAGIHFNIGSAHVEKACLTAEKLTQEQAEKKVVTEARWKVIMAQYKRPPELSTVEIRRFYRPYYRVEVSCMGKDSTQWIPADGFDNYFTYQ